MNKIILDLDGTLWETSEAYIYSYRKTCKTLNVPEELKSGESSVLSFLGVKLEDVLKTILPSVQDRQMLEKMLLGNVIEYLLKNPATYSKNIFSLFESLSKKYEVYIISNCPRPLLDAFYQISNVKQFIKDDNTIETSNKTEAIKRFTENYTKPALFVGDAQSDYDSVENHQMVRFVYASYGYKECANYDFYLSALDELPALIESAAQMAQILKKDKYEIISNGSSRITLIDKGSCYYFGFIDIKNIEDMDLILENLKSKARGKPLYGPINGSSWFNYRIALNEFDFKLYPDCLSDEKILAKFIEHRFVVAQRYASTLCHLKMSVWKKDKRVKLSSDYSCKIVRGKECYDYGTEIFNAAVKNFNDHIFYDSIDVNDFKELYLQSVSLCDPILILIYFKNEVVAFNFCYPDLEKRFFVEKTFSIAEKHRKVNVLIKMIELTYEVICNLGYERLLFHFQNENVKTMQSYFKGLVIRKKEYGVLKYEDEK
ncbi:MAG: HAD hydrolase-like protein [Treponema sp.]|nr:HAD hydrolase-like protein [Treponema sp.]